MINCKSWRIKDYTPRHNLILLADLAKNNIESREHLSEPRERLRVSSVSIGKDTLYWGNTVNTRVRLENSNMNIVNTGYVVLVSH